MAQQSNIWFAATDPALVPTPSPGYVAVFVANGASNTISGVLHKKDSTGVVSSALPNYEYTNEMAQDAIGAMVTNSATVWLTYDDANNLLTATIPDGAVSTTKLLDGAVTAPKLAIGSVGSSALAANAVQSGNIAPAAVQTAHIAAGSIQTTHIAVGALHASDVTGLGSAAFQSSTSFDAAGAAAAAQAASQPQSGTLAAIAALSTTAYGRSLLTLADATAQTALLDVATQSLKGLMSAADKVKLDNVGSGVYSVVNYGISTANTPAVNLAAWNNLMGVIADNATVSFPPSPYFYQFSGTLAIPAGKHLRITGSSNQKSIIATTSPTADIFTVGDWYTEFNGLQFASTITRTAGAAIVSGNNVGVNVTNCDFTGMWDGIFYTGGANAGNLALVSNCGFTNTLNRGIIIDGTNANTILEKVVMDGPLGQQQVGLELLQCGSVLVSNCDFIRSVNNCRFNPGVRDGVFSAYFVNVFFDTSPSSSVLFTSTGNVQRVKFTNCWFSGSVNGCEFASTAPTLPTAIDFITCDIFGNSGRGVWAHGVQDFSISSSRIAGNGTAGIEASASPGSVTKFTLSNNSICPTAGFGANGTGILINAGTYGGYAIKNNDVRNNTTANITDSGSVATSDLKILNDNIGHIITGSLGNLAVPVATGVVGSAFALLTVRVPPKAATAGQVFRVKLFGTSSSTGTLIFRVMAGATGAASDTTVWTSLTSAAQVANQRAGFDGLLTVRSAGVSGTVQCEALGFAHTAMLPSVASVVTTPTVNTTNAWYITLAVTVSSGSFTAHQAVVEAL